MGAFSVIVQLRRLIVYSTSLKLFPLASLTLAAAPPQPPQRPQVRLLCGLSLYLSNLCPIFCGLPPQKNISRQQKEEEGSDIKFWHPQSADRNLSWSWSEDTRVLQFFWSKLCNKIQNIWKKRQLHNCTVFSLLKDSVKTLLTMTFKRSLLT